MRNSTSRNCCSWERSVLELSFVEIGGSDGFDGAEGFGGFAGFGGFEGFGGFVEIGLVDYAETDC